MAHTRTTHTMMRIGRTVSPQSLKCLFCQISEAFGRVLPYHRPCGRAVGACDICFVRVSKDGTTASLLAHTDLEDGDLPVVFFKSWFGPKHPRWTPGWYAGSPMFQYLSDPTEEIARLDEFAGAPLVKDSEFTITALDQVIMLGLVWESCFDAKDRPTLSRRYQERAYIFLGIFNSADFKAFFLRLDAYKKKLYETNPQSCDWKKPGGRK